MTISIAISVNNNFYSKLAFVVLLLFFTFSFVSSTILLFANDKEERDLYFYAFSTLLSWSKHCPASLRLKWIFGLCWATETASKPKMEISEPHVKPVVTYISS